PACPAASGRCNPMPRARSSSLDSAWRASALPTTISHTATSSVRDAHSIADDRGLRLRHVAEEVDFADNEGGSTAMATTFTSDDSLVLLIDHQVGVLQWVVQSPPRELVAQNALKLANATEILDIPLIISTNQEDVNGRLMPELIAAAPTAYENRIQRSGTVDALADPAFAAAVEATGRRKL